MLGMNPQAVRVTMENGTLPIGNVIKREGRKTYNIEPDKLYRVTGIKWDGYQPEIGEQINYKLLAVAIIDEIAARLKQS